jgi:hypothetical protein
MPVSREQFDADLAAYNTEVGNYIAAVNAFLALPPVVDLSNEDAAVATALSAVQAAEAQLPPPPGKPA